MNVCFLKKFHSLSVSFISLQVNTTDVSNMGHTEVVNLVRAAPRVVDLVVGRVLEAPKPPIEAHLLPDICFKGSQKPLGKKQQSSSSQITHPWYFVPYLLNGLCFPRCSDV